MITSPRVVHFERLQCRVEPSFRIYSTLCRSADHLTNVVNSEWFLSKNTIKNTCKLKWTPTRFSHISIGKVSRPPNAHAQGPATGGSPSDWIWRVHRSANQWGCGSSIFWKADSVDLVQLLTGLYFTFLFSFFFLSAELGLYGVYSADIRMICMHRIYPRIPVLFY
jgi:hypothetical protein